MTAMTNPENRLPLMHALPKADVPTAEPLILASGSPRRAELLAAAGYDFRVELPDDAAEDPPTPDETAEHAVRRLAFQKAADVAGRLTDGWLLAADTLGCCDGTLLGKPRDEADAERMLRLLRGRTHRVLTGICLWDIAGRRMVLDDVCTELEMALLDDHTIAEHLRSMRWQGKAGGFGYQDGNDWLRVLPGGSESNVVGLPMERLAEVIQRFDEWAVPITN